MKKDNFYAKIALILSLGFWIPLFNIGLAATSIIMAMKALQKIDQNDKKYAGRKMAILSLAISLTVLITSIVTLAVFTWHKIENPDASFFPQILNRTG